jgi:hypothetical protein
MENNNAPMKDSNAPTESNNTPENNSEAKFVHALVPINRSGWAIAAGYVALFGIIPIGISLIAMILGIIGLIDIKKHPEKLGRGRCIFALIVGAIFTVTTVLFYISR